MTENILFNLSPGWALGADSEQWTILRRRKRQDEHYWQPLSFIGSTKSILHRTLREMGIQPTPEARAKISALPERYVDWRNEVDG